MRLAAFSIGRASLSRLSLTLAASSLAAACGGGGGGAPAAGDSPAPSAKVASTTGKELPKPGGGTFFVDPHQSGAGATLHLSETRWGRLVDVHDVDAAGAVRSEPRFRDFVIEPGLVSDGVDYTLVTGAVTQRTRLIVHAKKGSARFGALLSAASDALPLVEPKHDDGRSAPPFSLVPRNACLVLRLDDCLDDDASAAQALPETVRVRSGNPPLVPFGARLLFDPNHGGLVNGAFHSTRVLVDLTVSELEAATLPVPQPVNGLGLPASPVDVQAPSASVRIPTRLAAGAGQFTLLTNLAGVALDPAGNGPVDTAGPTGDVVRALRAGNAQDPNLGFLLDLELPCLVGDFGVQVERALADGGEFLVDLAFRSTCLAAPALGDVLAVGGALLEVLEPARIESGGRVTKLRVRAATPVAGPAALLGNGVLHAVFAPSRLRRSPAPCWVSFLPQASAQPDGVATTAQVRVRFSEPMDAQPLLDLDAFRVVRGPALQGTSTAGPTTTVLGELLASGALDAFAFAPSLPFAHAQGVAEPYHVELGEVRDLVGNPLRHALPFAEFRLDPNEPTQANGSLLLRFDGPDEIGPDGLPDLRGQFFFAFGEGAIRPRPAAFASWPVDRNVPVPSLMIPFAPGVQAPLNPLGSKLHALWRYCDLGWNVRDETKYNLDVAGLSWAPVGGNVLSDFYPQFEIRLGHSRFLPDESVDPNLLPKWTASGLPGAGFFEDNFLAGSNPTVVHNRALGYTIRPSDRFVASSGTTMIPYPLNRGGGAPITYTWRDTAVQSHAGPGNAGIPLDIEQGPPLFLEPQAGTIAPAGSVPSFGLPLLMEFRCFPTDLGIGLNALDISLAINSSPLPAFRAYSSGGINTAGLPQVVLPDQELVPQGGFNPISTPPGQRTMPAENAFYIGQLDTVARVSRVHSIWLDTGVANPGFVAPQMSPAAAAQPAGTQIALAFRGALGFSASPPAAPFDAQRLDAYGELPAGTVTFLNGVSTWSSAIQALDGARYLQVRLTFVNNVTSGASPALTALGIPFTVN